MNSSASPLPHEARSILGLAPLLKQAFTGTDLRPLANRWIELARQCRNANTLLDLSLALELLKKRESALAIQNDALRIAQHFCIAPEPAEVALRLLVLKTLGDLSANTPIKCLL